MIARINGKKINMKEVKNSPIWINRLEDMRVLINWFSIKKMMSLIDKNKRWMRFCYNPFNLIEAIPFN